jgi:tRNA pseudouridine32 synthase/23S rRNA pseudouridine746 synthase
MQISKFHPFNNEQIQDIPLPEKLTFPFYYEPHELSIIAANELQNYLKNQTDFEHNFGLDKKQKGLEIGKMFGVLVVQHSNGSLGHLWAFSGKLADTNHHEQFVPTVYDMLQDNGYFKQEELVLNRINAQLEELENHPAYLDAKAHVAKTQDQAQIEINQHKALIKNNKQQRAQIRSSATPTELEALSKASQEEGILLKKMTQYWQYKINEAQANLEVYLNPINTLKEARKQKSNDLQQRLFSEYAFLNIHQELKSLGDIFNGNPPAGAGECAAPKLLHYAFQHNLKPICMAEFWWGQSPKSEIRQHQQFYPACIGKCQPILAHMLKGLDVEPNPFAINTAQGKELPIIYEDDYLLAVNKPEEFLSVPGKLVTDSVQLRIQSIHPDAMIVHRLDMATSGLLLVAKNETIYKQLQQQFIKRTVQKRYIALLNGIVQQPTGTINLPLRLDIDNRPYQVVCEEYGKPAVTKYEVIEQINQQTRVYFYPITGRTHQLRVHASHQLGLHCPIVGDDLYGNKANRLHLHAESIIFTHPVTKERLTLQADPNF